MQIENDDLVHEISILFEDENVLVIDKPAGLLVHDVESSSLPTVVHWLSAYYPSVRGVGEDPSRPGIVHRLDRDTSGVMIIAKNNPTHQYLKRQFQSRKVQKTYRTIVYGTVKDDRGLIDRPIGKGQGDVLTRTAGAGARGTLRDALTYYTVLARFVGFTYLELYPKTGRTHQIRVHLKSIGHPIVCDPLYARGKTCPPELGRQALHALALEVDLPDLKAGLPGGKHQRFEAPMPADFARMLDRMVKL